MLANLAYLLALLAVSPLVIYRMLRHGRYRRGLRNKLCGLSRRDAERLRAGAARCVWFHAVSVGEVNLLPRLVSDFERANPQCRVVVSTSTDSGYDLAVDRFGEQRVFFCPLDFSWAVARTLRHLAPEQLVLAELELWPNLIRLASAAGIRISVINGRLSERSATRYQRFGWLTRSIFARLDWVGCQDERTRERFAGCGTAPRRCDVTGSLKFDQPAVEDDESNIQAAADWAGADPWHRIWVCGSTGPGEEEMVLSVYQQLRLQHPELRLVIVPRHRERFDQVDRLIVDSNLRSRRRSSGNSDRDPGWPSDEVILVDTIGELRHWWGVGQIATVGGSFGDRGGQNMIEPAAYGNAVCFGPDTRNFEFIAQRLIDTGGAVRVGDQQELESFVARCLVDIPAADSLGRAAKRFVDRQRGATARTAEALSSSLHPDPATNSRPPVAA